MADASDPGFSRDMVMALAREVADVLAGDPPGDHLLTAREVAARLNVDRGWVYAHADELDVVRIGDGPRPRLRFVPAVIAQRQLPSRGRTSAAPASKQEVALLPIGPARGRRLGTRR